MDDKDYDNDEIPRMTMSDDVTVPVYDDNDYDNDNDNDR